jgi:hypothetical protein
MARNSHHRYSSRVLCEALHQLDLIESDTVCGVGSLVDLRQAAINELAATLATEDDEASWPDPC